MSTELIPAGRNSVVLTGVDLPPSPPTRVYISGHRYNLAAPQIALPPIANVVRAVFNFAGPGARLAKVILHLLKGTGSGSTSDPVWLKSLANNLMNQWDLSNMQSTYTSSWTLSSITCRDSGGTSAASTSDHVAIPGNVIGAAFPPQVAMVLSWQIAESYRGGKPRSYLPGVPTSSAVTVGGSAIDPTFALNADTVSTTFLTNVNTALVSTTAVSLGTVSYHAGHAVRPTPLFRTYLSVKVHQRLDSQRRRSGQESAFGVTP